ncbi:peptidoglycan-binding LysM domain-containing protein [Trifolium repens]|jgi:hypothetical protein|nr:peptidoglycan-binding LysM domain-containing protein [Trifolium repens]
MKTKTSLVGYFIILLITCLVAVLLIVNYAKDIEYINELPCDEYYVVEEGETLDSIGFKCSDPYIISRNPHVHDAQDIFPGELLRIIAQPFHDDYDFSL